MSKEYHILNGDALLDQFPPGILGERIVARECLVDGPVAGESMDTFYRNRHQFLRSHYDNQLNWEEYKEKSVDEFERISAIDDDPIINLWFERDLFCQVNLWFVSNLLDSNARIFLVLPTSSLQYGFGGMDSQALLDAYSNRLSIDSSVLSLLGELWKAYKSENIDHLKEVALRIPTDFLFMRDAIQAHEERVRTDLRFGRPEATLRTIISELNTKEFGPIFKEFGRLEGIYGYGDIQVKRIYDYILEGDN